MTEFIVENPHEPVSLEFVMHGPIFDNGLPLPLTIKSLEAVQGIIDRSYLILAGKTKMSAQERSLFYMESQGIQRGSLTTNLGLVFNATQLALPIFSDLGPAGVWAYAKQSFEFLKLIFGAKKEGVPVKISKSGDGATITVITGTQNNTYNGPVFNIANSSLSHYEYLTHQLDESKVTDIRLGRGSVGEISFNLLDKELFDLPSKVHEISHTMRCEIYEFDKYVGSGKVKVFPGQVIESGEYKFSVIGKQNVSDYIAAMLQKEVLVTCLKVTVDHPLRGETVSSLQVINVKK